MHPLKILHVTPYWADAWAYGGIPRVVGALAHQLAADGHDVTVCATDACSSSARLPAGPRALANGLTLRVFPNRSNRLAHDWQAFTPVGLHAYLRSHARDFDVAHLHACRNLPGVVAAHHLARFEVPYVVAPNGTAPVIERRRLAKRVFDLTAGTRMLRRAAAVVAVSQAERAQLLMLGVPDDHVHVVPNPIDLGEFDPPVERGRFRQRAGLGDAPIVLFLGKVTPRKRLDVLASAFARSGRGAQLVIAGNDMGGLADMRSQLAQLGVDHRVRFTGLLTGRERLEALADGDVVVYPSEHEVFGLVPLEALLVGTPVIVSDDSGCGEIVQATGGGVVTPAGDVAALGRALETVLTAPGDWRQQARAAAARVRQRYGAARVADGLVDVYRQIVTPSRSDAVRRTGVSVVVPVKNGGPGLARTIASIEAQADGRPMEIIAVDDGSSDESAAVLAALAHAGRLRLLQGSARGTSAALNLGIGAATFPIICQVDQDVELLPDWMTRLVATLDADATLAAVQGHYTVDPDAPLPARVMAIDLEQRYAAMRGGDISHVCTGNVAYRRDALDAAGPFDERIGYGNDNDMSYRLRRAGWRLAHCAQARSVHRWRDTLSGYCRQQYGVGYGRLDVVARHPSRVRGDSVSPATMMAHPLIFGLALAALAAAGVLRVIGLPWGWTAAAGGGLIGVLFIERARAGIAACWRYSDAAGLWFPVLHLVRDAAWVVAIVTWTCRRLTGRAGGPSDSMRARPTRPPAAPATFVPRASHTVVVVPVHNEAASIGAVIADVRSHCPTIDLLVVDDGSSDGTAEVLERSGTRWLQLPERLGVGSAMRAALRYARRHGYDSVVRVDGDGQHGASDVDRLLAPIREGRADVVLGSRYLAAPATGPSVIRAAQRALGLSLTALTGRRVTDPTSGFCALGPRALVLLTEHHPTGYPEAELRLLLNRHALVVLEVPVASRPRLGGRSTLTAGRLLAAAARVLLAILIVPLRRNVGGRYGD